MPEALRHGTAVDGDTVHADAVERRVVALGAHRLAQDPAHAVPQRAGLGRKRQDPLQDPVFRFPGQQGARRVCGRGAGHGGRLGTGVAGGSALPPVLQVGPGNPCRVGGRTGARKRPRHKHL